MAKPTLTGKALAATKKPATAGTAKKASAPGQMKKAAGVQSAKTFTKGYGKTK